jgi:acyl-CoA thioester hydrolase
MLESPHRFTLRVYYEDTDAGGMVYHATYLRFAERARTEALRDFGVPHAALVSEFRRMFVVRRVKLDYLRPARLDESLTVLTTPTRLGAASVDLLQVIERAGVRVAAAEIDLACVDIATGRPQRLPPAWQQALASNLSSHATAGCVAAGMKE